MGTALLSGSLASSSFVVGVLLGLFTNPSRGVVAGVIGFGAGVLGYIVGVWTAVGVVAPASRWPRPWASPARCC